MTTKKCQWLDAVPRVAPLANIDLGLTAQYFLIGRDPS